MTTINDLEPVCIGCGCSYFDPCEGGCSWIAMNADNTRGVCSECPEELPRFEAGNCVLSTAAADYLDAAIEETVARIVGTR